MPKAGGGAGGDTKAPPHGQVYLPEWRCVYDCLVRMLRQKHAQAQALALDLEFQRKREDTFQTRIQQILADEARRKRAGEAETAVLVGGKEVELRCYQKLAERTENDLEELRSFICTLAAENTELKMKLKEAETKAGLSENNSEHQHSAKDLRAELRRLKQAYKTLNSEKGKEISALSAEKNFVWNQLQRMEDDYRMACKKKTIEANQATEAAQKLQQNVDDLIVAAQEKDDEVKRLQAELVNAKEKMLNLEDELQRMRSLVKGKGVEIDKHKDDQAETSRNCKDINETNRKSRSEGPALMEKSRNSHVTPVRTGVKTSRNCTPSAKEIQNQSRNNSQRHNVAGRGQSEASQKRKRSSSLPYGPRRFSTRHHVRAAASPMLFSPGFTIPKLAPTPP